MLLLRLWVPRYPATTERRRGGIPIRKLPAIFKTRRVAKRLEEIEDKEVQIVREGATPILSGRVINQGRPSFKGRDWAPELKLISGLEYLLVVQETAILQGLRARDEEDMLLLLLLEG